MYPFITDDGFAWLPWFLTVYSAFIDLLYIYCSCMQMLHSSCCIFYIVLYVYCAVCLTTTTDGIITLSCVCLFCVLKCNKSNVKKGDLVCPQWDQEPDSYQNIKQTMGGRVWGLQVDMRIFNKALYLFTQLFVVSLPLKLRIKGGFKHFEKIKSNVHCLYQSIWIKY